MKIAHLTRSGRYGIAHAPEYTRRVIDQYTEHTAVMGWKDRIKADFYHCHNRMPYWLLEMIRRDPQTINRVCMQFHSPPQHVKDGLQHVKKIGTSRCLVVAQRHVTLPAYRGFYLCRNPIDIYEKALLQKPFPTDKVRVVYTPSNITASNQWWSKGYEETMPILKRLKARYPKRFDYKFLHGRPLGEVFRAKAWGNVVIGEVTNGSYSRSGMEGLSMGRLAYAWMLPYVEEVFKRVSGSDEIPFELTGALELEPALARLVEKGPQSFEEAADSKRKWMETYWNPVHIAEEYVGHYKRIMESNYGD